MHIALHVGNFWLILLGVDICVTEKPRKCLHIAPPNSVLSRSLIPLLTHSNLLEYPEEQS